MNYKQYLQLLTESTASDDMRKKKAELMGLTHVGYGNWKNKKGEVYQWDDKKLDFYIQHSDTPKNVIPVKPHGEDKIQDELFASLSEYESKEEFLIEIGASRERIQEVRNKMIPIQRKINQYLGQKIYDIGD